MRRLKNKILNSIMGPEVKVNYRRTTSPDFPTFTLTFILWGSILINLSTASFNLYIGVDEVKTLLGLSNELYYVREGVPNVYALQFTVPVPPHVDALHFKWQTLGQKPLPYSASMEIAESLAMSKPVMNISSKGNIPTDPQTFQISFPCTGTTSDEAHFELTLNVTSITHLRTLNVTTIVLKRQRICLKDSHNFVKTRHRGGGVSGGPLSGHPNSKLHPVGGGTENQSHSSKSSKTKSNRPHSLLPPPPSSTQDIGNGNSSVILAIPQDEMFENSNWIYVLLGGSVGLVFILIVFVLGAFAYFRTKKVENTAESNGFLHVDTSGNGSSGSSGSGTVSGSGGSLFLRSDSPHHYSSLSPSQSDLFYTYSTYNHQLPPPPLYSEVSTQNSYSKSTHLSTMDSIHSSKLAEMMTIARCKVRLQGVILEGTFAKIYNGTVLERDGSEKKVIVKTVNDHSSPVQMALLLHEGLSLVGMTQQHVFTVFGVAAEERASPFLIYPDDGFRNLKRFLQRCRSGPGRPITAQEVVHMAIQIGSGMAFLHRQNVIHRDVSARNCVVDDKLMVKVSDSALSRDLFPDDYQWTGESESRPIKWMAPESIVQNRSSTPADMWSFGVLLWELFTLAQQPYLEVECGELVSFLKMGYRLAHPINCPDELYSAMKRCWTWDEDDRPKWTHVLPELQDLYAQLAQYV